MKVLIIHGQMHKGSTYHVTDILRRAIVDIDGDTIVSELFLPAAGPSFCIGCFSCIKKDAHLCPDHEKVQNIVSQMIDSDILMIDSPTYCLEMTGQLKTLFDHLGYMWLSHRPQETMFGKIVVGISTSAGAGHHNVAKNICRQFCWMGVSQRYKFAFGVSASKWEEVSEARKKSIKDKAEKLAPRIINALHRRKFNLKVRFLFSIMRMMQKGNNWSPVDRKHWENHGWLGRARPWS